jgi:hypothetical protein
MLRPVVSKSRIVSPMSAGSSSTIRCASKIAASSGPMFFSTSCLIFVICCRVTTIARSKRLISSTRFAGSTA